MGLTTKTLFNAEQLLKQGKTQAALALLGDLSQVSPRDLLALNRVGDLLARGGQNSDAVRCYSTIARHFSQGGFTTKAIAIYKKILKLDADRPEALRELGEMYLRQELMGEASAHLLRAAERYLQSQSFDRAREVYETLCKAQPDNALHRVRLAETLAAEGHADQAGERLLELGATLLDAGRPDDAEKAYRRAHDLLGENSDAVCGLALCLASLDRGDEAIGDLERRRNGQSGDPAVCATLAVLYDMSGRHDETEAVLRNSEAPECLEHYIRRTLGHPETRTRLGDAWLRADRVLEGWGPSEGVEQALERLCWIEEEGHLPALERIYRYHRGEGHDSRVLQAGQKLIETYQARSMHAEAARLARELADHGNDGQGTAAADTRPDQTRARPVPQTPTAVPAEEGRAAAPAVAPAAAPAEPPPPKDVSDPETPAVPLNPADHEFVNGHLTEAEVLEKYGLASEALQRLRIVAARFPGHVEAQNRLVALLRGQADRPALRDALVKRALALRASGDGAGAAESAREASQAAPLSDEQRAVLERLGLLEASTSPAPSAGKTEAEDEVEIVFEDEAAPKPEAGPGPRRLPPAELLEEIESLREAGQLDAARQKLEALRVLGYGGARLDELGSQVGAPAKQAAADSSRLDDDELGEIAAALKSELSDVGSAPADPQPEAGEESLEEVFEAFKRHVEEEVGTEDYRTHYDLGIGYKEMGLLQDAVQAFEIAARSPQLRRDACAMLAVCQRELGNIPEAVRHYREAIEIQAGSDEDLDLRYELAEALLNQGDAAAALNEFQVVLAQDPGFRDVRDRVNELETKLNG